LQLELTNDRRKLKADHLFVLLPEGSKGAGFPELAGALRKSRFGGRSEETITILLEGKPSKITLVGLGKPDKLKVRSLRSAVLAVARRARKGRETHIALALEGRIDERSDSDMVRLLADAIVHSDYRFDSYITVREDAEPKPIRFSILAPVSVSTRELRTIKAEAEAISSAVQTVRNLGNAPGNEVTPERLAERAREVARETGVKCTIFDKRQIEKMKMGGLLAVNKGSALEPRFVVLEYSPARARKTVCLVGKGITFDSGGISIKPAEKMEEMKFDMCGAATVIGTIEAAARLKIPVKIVGIFAATENLPGGSAYKPGDIVTMMSGKTVEIVNTDAEGRMILGDALHYAARYKPDHLLDFATLTGACVVALAAEATGLFSNDEALAQKLIEAGERVGERFWRMPEWDDYKEYIRSDWADMKNSGGRWGGAVTAAVFLKEFVNCPSWAHIDIAGTAYSDDGARGPKGATGVGVRATIAWLRSLAG
jgi:leucyl aminopeptidase